jgi:hypothetical protein
MALDNPDSGDPGDIYRQLRVLTDTLKERYDFKTRDDFITQAINEVIQTCNIFSSKSQLVRSIPSEPLFIVIDYLPFSTKSDVEKVVAILKEMEPKGKPPPDVKSYHKHLMDSFINKVNESAVPLEYFDEKTLKWLVPKLSHLNLLGLEAGKFLDTYRPENAKTYSISAKEFAKLSPERQEEIAPKITHFDLKEIHADRFNEMLQQAVNAKTYSINARDLAGFSVEEISEIAPKITDLKISDRDLSDEQFASLMENCINLCHLKIRTNANSLPDLWPFIKQLKTLDCSKSRNLEKLPDNMPQIRELICFRCPVESLPGNVRKLRQLDCSGCPVESLPDNMPQIRELDCSYCHNLKNLPVNMPQIRKLICDGCRNLKNLPVNMLELRELDCRLCHNLEKLPDNMPQIRKLNCFNCPVESLPDNMPQIRELTCGGCPVESLPGNMRQIREITCVGCRNLKNLPVNMLELRKLLCWGCPQLSEINVPSGCVVKR